MPISIDWPSRVISIPRADLQIIQSTPTEIRQLDLDAFRLELRDLEDSEEGIVYPRTHDRNAPVVISGVGLAQVLEIVNDYTVTFEDGQYAVNIVGGNTNVGDRVNVNQVSVRTSNSAGLTFSKEVQDQAFLDGRVFIDTLEGLPGTQFPRGTPGQPVSNLADAKAIIESRNLPKRLYLRGAITVPSGDNLDNYDIQGVSFAQSSITLDLGSSANNVKVIRCSVTNSFLGATSDFEECLLLNCSNFGGLADRCQVNGTMLVSTDSVFRDCFGTAGLIPSAADLSISVLGFRGFFTLAGLVDPDTTVNIGFKEGQAIIDSSCTDGTVIVAIDSASVAQDDSSGASVTILSQDQLTQGGLLQLQSAMAVIDTLVDEMWRDMGLDPANPISVTTNSPDSVDTVVAAITKFHRRVGNVITITRQP